MSEKKMSHGKLLAQAADTIIRLDNELWHYKDFYERMRKACPAAYVEVHESTDAQAFALKAMRAIKEMQLREVLAFDNFVLRVSDFRYLQYFYEDEYSEQDEDYEATDKLPEAAVFYSQADAEAARERLQKISGVIAEIQKR